MKIGSRGLLPCLLLLMTLLGSMLPASQAFATPEDLWRELRAGGLVMLIRHARAPGTGDPPNFRLEACETQRNLSEEGRRQSSELGRRIRENGVPVSAVLHSRWCRARDTATLAFGDLARPEPFLDSFFADRSTSDEQTAALQRFVTAWQPEPGVAVLVTHQVNITALTGVTPREGEAIIVRPKGPSFELVGRLRF